jgi:ribosomal protein S1
MAVKRRDYYSGRNGGSALLEGVAAEARVVSVIRAGIFVDIFGVETYIPLRELSHQRISDASLMFETGQRVIVKMMEIKRSGRDVSVTASVKQVNENPAKKAIRRYVPGNRYVGTVSMVDTNGVFVSFDGGVDCLCTYSKRGRPLRGARVTVQVIGADYEKNRIWGAITHMGPAR